MRGKEHMDRKNRGITTLVIIAMALTNLSPYIMNAEEIKGIIRETKSEFGEVDTKELDGEDNEVDNKEVDNKEVDNKEEGNKKEGNKEEDNNNNNKEVNNQPQEASIQPIANTESDFEWGTLGSGVEITGYTGLSKEVTIPSVIDGKPVTSIGDEAFVWNGLTSVVIPDSVESIGWGAFRNNQLTSVEIPDSVRSIGDGAFDSNNLTSVDLGKGVRSIGYYAFDRNNLTSVVIPDSVERISSDAFRGNPVKELHLGKNASFEDEVFGYTSASSSGGNVTRHNGQVLEKITVHEGNPNFTYKNNILYSKDESIIWNALVGVESKDIESSSKLKEIKGYAFLNTASKTKLDKGLTLPDGLEIIGSRAFEGNQLISVEIPNSVTSIGSYAISNNQLTSVVIPVSVESIGTSAFSNNQLTSVEIPDSITSIGNNVFRENNLTSVEIPDSVTSIGIDTFYKNQLTSVEIPNSVTSIGIGAFWENQLTSVGIPDSVESIGSGAFRNNHLTRLEIGKGVTSIGNQAFYNNQLNSVTIPDSVRSIGNEAFFGNQLTSVEIPNSVESIGWAAFDGNAEEGLYFVIYGYYGTEAERYAKSVPHTFNGKYLFTWKEINNNKEIEITGYKGESKEVTIPSEIDGKPVTVIGNRAFSSKGLTRVDLPKYLREIEGHAFAFNKLTTIDIPESVKEMGEYSISNNGLKGVRLPKGLKVIENGLLANNNIEEMEIPKSVEEIKEYAFMGNNINTIKLNEGLKVIREGAFQRNGIGEIVFPDTLIEIEGYAFSDNKIKEVIIPRNITKMGNVNGEYEGDNVFTGNTDKSTDFVITGYYGTEAEYYANRVNHTFNGYDDTPPTGKITGNPTKWTMEDATLTFKAEDDESGVKRVQKPGGSWVKGNSTTYTVTENGTYTFKAEDNAGNVSEFSVKVDKIDKSSPKLSSSLKDTSWTRDTVDIEVESDETLSGLVDITMVGSPLEGRNLISESDVYYTEEDKVFGGGKANFLTKLNHVYGKDARIIRNKSVVTSLYINIEGYTGGRIGYESTNMLEDGSENHVIERAWLGNSQGDDKRIVGGKYKGVIKHHHKVRDSDYYVKEDDTGIYNQLTGTGYKFTVGRPKFEIGEEATPWTPAPEDIKLEGLTKTFPVSVNGEYTFEAEYGNGNKKQTTIEVGNIDREPPKITVNNNPMKWDDRDEIDLEVNLKDTGSGLSHILLPDGSREDLSGNEGSIKYTVSNNGKYTFKVYDKVGNEEVKTVEVSYMMVPFSFIARDKDNKPVEGAVYELLRDGKVYKEATSDSSGLVDFKKVPATGKYTVRLISTPGGNNNSGEIEVNPGEDDDSAPEIIVHERGDTLPATGTYDGVVLTVVLLTLLIGIMYTRKKE